MFNSLKNLRKKKIFFFKINVDLRAILDEEIIEKQKKHTDLMWFNGLLTSTKQRKIFSLYVKLGLHNRIFILIIR